MAFEWDPAKNAANIAKHGVGFATAARIFEGGPESSLLDLRNARSENAMTKRFKKELTPAELAALPDDQIDTSDIPELDESFWKHAQVREPEGTEQVTLRVKKSVLQTFKATGKGYQTRMNAVLEAYARTLQK